MQVKFRCITSNKKVFPKRATMPKAILHHRIKPRRFDCPKLSAKDFAALFTTTYAKLLITPRNQKVSVLRQYTDEVMQAITDRDRSWGHVTGDQGLQCMGYGGLKHSECRVLPFSRDLAKEHKKVKGWQHCCLANIFPSLFFY